MYKSQQLSIQQTNQTPQSLTGLVQSQIINKTASLQSNLETNDKQYIPFKQKYPQRTREKWLNEAQIQFPTKTPIILETTTYKDVQSRFQYVISFIHNAPLLEMEQIQNPKFLVPNNFEIRHLTAILKERLGIEKNETIIIFANNLVLKPNRIVNEIYQKHKDNDGFLYLKYIKENSFG